VNRLRVYVPPADLFDSDGYPAAWQVIKHQVREAAGHRCVRCGHPYRTGKSPPEWSPCDTSCNHDGPFRAWSEYGDPIPLEHEAAGALELLRCGDASRVEAQWRILTVHHFTGDKADCRWWNLGSLCQRCHLTIQGKVVMDRRWVYEHSGWFRPYAAGWYAWHLLGENITRETAVARMDELLALEYRQLDLGVGTLGEPGYPA
jgi:hypothetical protein